MRALFYVLGAWLLMCASSSAQISDFTLTEVPNNLVPGFRTYDLSVTGTGQLTVLEMLAELDSGTFFQHLFGSYTPPPQGLFDFAPDLAFDTFIGLGGATAADSLSPIFIPGGAIDIGGGVPVTFDDTLLDITWTAPEIHNPADYFIARLTVSNEAHGSLHLKGLMIPPGSGPGGYVTHEVALDIQSDGQIIPEPSSLLCVTTGFLAIVVGGRHRARRSNLTHTIYPQ